MSILKSILKSIQSLETWCYTRHHRNKQRIHNLGRTQALAIIPADEDPYEIMKAWKLAVCQQYGGIEKVPYYLCETPYVNRHQSGFRYTARFLNTLRRCLKILAE
jgi:hypothetical protein